MPLEEYNRKRDFTKTREPAGKVSTKSGGGRFVIQKHDATRMHFDLRLEIDGVYKSWAVPKGPSLNPANKRLAVEVEDHPLSYGTFEGTIPEGEYGGGTVMLWDRGTFECDEPPAKVLEDGNMKITFHGERMKGKWALILMHTKREDDEKRNWLLIKEKDDAVSTAKKDITDQYMTSVKSSRSMDDLAKADESLDDVDDSEDD